MLPDPTRTPATPDVPDDLGVTTGSRVVSGGLWSVLSRIVPQLQLLALSIIAARFLGPDGMGRQSFIAFVALSVVLVATAGLPASLSRFVGELLGARAGGVALGVYALTWRVEMAAAVLASATLGTAALLGSEPEAAWALAGVTAGLAVLQSVPQSLLSGAQRWREATVVGVTTGVAAVPVTIAVLAAGGGITGIFAVEAATVAVNLVWTSALARRLVSALPPVTEIPPEVRRRFVSFAAVSTGLVLIQYVIWRRSELIVLDRVSSDAEIALYSIAFAIVFGLARIPEAVAKVTMPAVATLVGAGELDRVRSGFWRATRLIVFMTPPVVAGAAVTGPPVIELAYGPEFAGAGDVLLVLLVPLLVLPLLMTSEALLFALARLRFLFAVSLAATVVDVALSVVLIPRLDAVGAGIANAAAQLTAGVPCLVLAARLHRPVDVAWGPFARGLGLAAAVAAAAWLALDLAGDGLPGVALGVLAGVAVFVAGAALARPLPAGDAAWLAAALDGDGRARHALAGAVRRLAPRAP